MKKSLIVFALILLAGGVFLAAVDYRFEESDTIKKTLHFQGAERHKEIQVDNIFGSIELTGYDRPEVKLVAHRTIKGRTQARIQKAKEEVKLDISEEGNLIDIFVNGPFRNQDKQDNREKWDPGYIVSYNFEIHVPNKTHIFLKTVTDGDIVVNNINGDFEVKNINGKVTLSQVTGSGSVETVNGEVKVVFSRNPESDCSFKTVHGDLEILFKDDLSADFLLKTSFGKAYSNFEYKELPGKGIKVKRSKGKYVYINERFLDIRVGKGGPRIKMDTLVGDLIIKKQ